MMRVASTWFDDRRCPRPRPRARTTHPIRVPTRAKSAEHAKTRRQQYSTCKEGGKGCLSDTGSNDTQMSLDSFPSLKGEDGGTTENDKVRPYCTSNR
jgi:hypothetical protein